jgi:hypothetical protein
MIVYVCEIGWSLPKTHSQYTSYILKSNKFDEKALYNENTLFSLDLEKVQNEGELFLEKRKILSSGETPYYMLWEITIDDELTEQDLYELDHYYNSDIVLESLYYDFGNLLEYKEKE